MNGEKKPATATKKVLKIEDSDDDDYVKPAPKRANNAKAPTKVLSDSDIELIDVPSKKSSPSTGSDFEMEEVEVKPKGKAKAKTTAAVKRKRYVYIVTTDLRTCTNPC